MSLKDHRLEGEREEVKLEKDSDDTGLGGLGGLVGFHQECQEAAGRLWFKARAGSAFLCVSLWVRPRPRAGLADVAEEVRPIEETTGRAWPDGPLSTLILFSSLSVFLFPLSSFVLHSLDETIVFQFGMVNCPLAFLTSIHVKDVCTLVPVP